MAAEDSSSTGILKVDEEELFSVESCWVEARTTCDHLSFKSSYYDSMYLEIKTNQGVITLLKTGCVLAAKIFSAIVLSISTW
ncbi:uncharacterized protein LOC122047673 isoform X2 [Zingiber officinale]|uniref:uncharacterized protein LOC122047673 isoform X2 n=1 Tax=Zingiber officinale TaxID=94328 RepID=UPI001C4D238D|nr:uncharacterized protein LOC122047673 isoform X2 [Zingiber officinale]